MRAKLFIFLSVVICSMQAYAADEIDFSSHAAEEQIFSNQQMALLYLSCANANLMGQNYSSAVEDYQKALDTLGSSGNNGVEFLALFGMSIACDHLNLREQCECSMLRIKTLMNLSIDEDEEGSFMEEVLPNDEIVSYLRTLAYMAPSIDVRGTLLSYVSEIFPTFLASGSFFFGRISPAFQYYESGYMVLPCKSVWKKMEKLGHNVYRVCDKVLNLIIKALDIKDRVQGEPKNREFVILNKPI